MAHRIAIVDDEEQVRLSTAALLSCAGYTSTMFDGGASFLASDMAPLAAALLDLRMPHPDGLAVLSELQNHPNTPPVLVLSGHGDIGLAVQAMKLGAVDFLEKPYRADELIERLGAAIAGQSDVGEEVENEASRLIKSLSLRQHDVLVGMVQGQPNKVIAWQLGLSTRTIEAYRAQLLEKLGVKSSAQAVRLAVLGGLGSALARR